MENFYVLVVNDGEIKMEVIWFLLIMISEPKQKGGHGNIVLQGLFDKG